jgi:DNA ligase-1
MIHDSYLTFLLVGDEPFEERYNVLRKTFGEGATHAEKQIQVVSQELVKDRQHVLDRLKEIEILLGEGLVLRKAGSYVLSIIFPVI